MLKHIFLQKEQRSRFGGFLNFPLPTTYFLAVSHFAPFPTTTDIGPKYA